MMPWDSVVDLIREWIDKIWPYKTKSDKAQASLVRDESCFLSSFFSSLSTGYKRSSVKDCPLCEVEQGKLAILLADGTSFVRVIADA